jgi:hypothetical protein
MSSLIQYCEIRCCGKWKKGDNTSETCIKKQNKITINQSIEPEIHILGKEYEAINSDVGEDTLIISVHSS